MMRVIEFEQQHAEPITEFGQVFLVVEGCGRVAGADGHRLTLAAGQGAHITWGEVHAKGSETGMTATMFQMDDLRATAPGISRRGRRSRSEA